MGVFPHPLLVSAVKAPTRATGGRHVKVKHLKRDGDTACKTAKAKRNSPVLVMPLFADEPDDVTCKRCLKYVRCVGNPLLP
jgi:hypothetical protein